MSVLQFKLLGHFKVLRDDGGEIFITSRKGRALLAYLAVCPGQRETRHKLATLFWGERFDEQARGSLRQCLSDLRKEFNEAELAPLLIEGDWVALDSELISVDVLLLEALSDATDLAALQTAIDLYKGDFFEDFDLDDPGLSEWLHHTRERIRELTSVCLLKLVEYQAADNAAEQALSTAQRLIVLDPLREDGHRWLMRLYEQLGRRNDALQQYQICVDAVSQSLGVDPEADTKALFERIRGGKAIESAAKPMGDTDTPASLAKTSRPAAASIRSWFTGTRIAVAGALAGIAVALTVYFGNTQEADFPLPDQPSIAVIPFANLSGDVTQDYFSDGITADIIAKLSRVPNLFVVDSHSSFSYKSKSIPARQICRELGVRYIASGQIQVVGKSVRITTSLVDGITSQQIWAEQFKGEMEDISALQDKITDSIAGNILADITFHQEIVVRKKPTKNFKAYDYVLRGRQYLYDLTPASNAAARKLYQKALSLDPEYALAHAYLAWTHLNDMRLAWTDDPEQARQQAFASAKRAVALDHATPEGHEALGDAYLWTGQHEMALKELNHALGLNPNGAGILAKLGDILTWAGQPDVGIEYLDQATARNRHFPYIYLWYRAHADFVAGRYEQALARLRELTDRKPDFVPAHLYLAVILGVTDRLEEAQIALMKAMSFHPNLSGRLSAVTFPYKNPAQGKLVSGTLAKVAISLK